MSEIDFQPMLKRFMVWHRRGRGWLKGNSGEFILNLVDISKELRCNPNLPADCIICQSTNLFDKGGKEIFEGSIVRVGGETGIVQMVLGEWHAVGDDDIPLSVWNPSGIEILGHILSNPELLEEE